MFSDIPIAVKRSRTALELVQDETFNNNLFNEYYYSSFSPSSPYNNYYSQNGHNFTPFNFTQMDDDGYSNPFEEDEYPYLPLNMPEVYIIPSPQQEEKKQKQTKILSIINTPVVIIPKQEAMEEENGGSDGGSGNDNNSNGDSSDSDNSSIAGSGSSGDSDDDDDHQQLDLIRHNIYFGKGINGNNLKKAVVMYKNYENLVVICKLCNKRIYNLEFFGYNRDNCICIECAAKEYSSVGELKDRYPENGRVRCKRLAHFKPEWQFVKHSQRSGYITVNLCIHCRNCKRFEYLVKSLNKKSNSRHH